MTVHDGHRQRVRQRFLSEGLDGFDEHQALEMLLFYCIGRRDTNELAHALIAEFGSLSRVMEAPVAALKRVPGIGEQAAVFLSFISAFNRYHLVKKAKERADILTTVESCGSYLMPYFHGITNEVVYILCLDAKCKVLCCRLVGEGGVNSANVPIRRVAEIALNFNASSVILAHNHPSGLALPSDEDISTTRKVCSVLRKLDIVLTDHLIFSDDDYVSLAQSKCFDAGSAYEI